jgi:hypothetical protein
MNFLDSILTSMVVSAAAKAGQGLYYWLKKYLTDTFKDQSEKKIVQTLEEVGNLAWLRPRLNLTVNQSSRWG